MVGGTIPDDDCVFAPVLVLAVQHLHQLRQVDLHRLPIRIGLKEADEDLPEVVHAGDEGDPWHDSDQLLSYLFLSRLPTAPLVRNGVQPALVNIDEAPLCL